VSYLKLNMSTQTVNQLEATTASTAKTLAVAGGAIACFSGAALGAVVAGNALTKEYKADSLTGELMTAGGTSSEEASDLVSAPGITALGRGYQREMLQARYEGHDSVYKNQAVAKVSSMVYGEEEETANLYRGVHNVGADGRETMTTEGGFSFSLAPDSKTATFERKSAQSGGDSARRHLSAPVSVWDSDHGKYGYYSTATGQFIEKVPAEYAKCPERLYRRRSQEELDALFEIANNKDQAVAENVLDLVTGIGELVPGPVGVISGVLNYINAPSWGNFFDIGLSALGIFGKSAKAAAIGNAGDLGVIGKIAKIARMYDAAAITTRTGVGLASILAGKTLDWVTADDSVSIAWSKSTMRNGFELADLAIRGAAFAAGPRKIKRLEKNRPGYRHERKSLRRFSQVLDRGQVCECRQRGASGDPVRHRHSCGVPSLPVIAGQLRESCNWRRHCGDAGARREQGVEVQGRPAPGPVPGADDGHGLRVHDVFQGRGQVQRRRRLFQVGVQRRRWEDDPH
jgi:hypothetical protein